MKLYLNRYHSIVFTHIPKCGGTSIRKYLCDSAINSSISHSEIYIPEFLDVPNNKNLSQLNQNELEIIQAKQVKVLGDHSKFNAHNTFGLKMERPFYFTMLRDPLKRFISHYRFFYFGQGYGNMKERHLNDLSTEELKRVIASLRNIMIDYISNRNESKEPKHSRELLIRAIYNLENHISCFGILEEAEKSLQLLSKYSPPWITFGLELPTLNKTQSQVPFAPVNDNVISLFNEYNQNDIEFFKFAKNLFDLRYKMYV